MIIRSDTKCLHWRDLVKRRKKCSQLASKGCRVVLHRFGPGVNAPDPSPFAMKLETWMRASNIKYITDFDMVYLIAKLVRHVLQYAKRIKDSLLPTQYVIKRPRCKNATKVFSPVFFAYFFSLLTQWQVKDPGSHWTERKWQIRNYLLSDWQTHLTLSFIPMSAKEMSL